jgi:hypothetical protein
MGHTEFEAFTEGLGFEALYIFNAKYQLDSRLPTLHSFACLMDKQLLVSVTVAQYYQPILSKRFEPK